MFRFFISALVFISISTFALAQDITYQVDGKDYEGYIINKGKNAPLVFLVHDWDGIDEYEKKRSKMLSDLGYSVFAIDMFGKGERPQEVEKKKAKTGELYKDRKKMRMLLNEGFKAAQKAGLNVKNAATVGYCFGGTTILEWAKAGAPLKGFVSFHGGLAVTDGDTYKESKGKLLILHGTADEAVSMQDFASLAVLLEQEKIPHEMITYSGAPHAFTKFGTDRYRKDADEKSWIRFSSFLKEHL